MPPSTTIPSPTMPLPPKLYQWFVGAFAALGAFTYGYDLGMYWLTVLIKV
jgi:hypothetical protein